MAAPALTCSHGICVYNKDVVCLEKDATCIKTGKYTSNCYIGLACYKSGTTDDSTTCQACVGQCKKCSTAAQNCCQGFRCNEQNQTCTLRSAVADCTADTDCERFGCENLTCFAGSCASCAEENAACGCDLPDCCTNLTCFSDGVSGTCQNCTVENDNCTDADGAVPCCGTLTCYDGTCQNCIVENGKCTDAVSCCGNMTCFSGNSTCQNCTVEMHECGENCPDCCTGFSCFKDKCHYHSETQPCGGNYPVCCTGLVCYDDKCQNCTIMGKPCSEEFGAKECCDGPDKAKCMKETCSPCITEKADCTVAQNSWNSYCCGESTCWDGACQAFVGENGYCSDVVFKKCCGNLVCRDSNCTT